MSNSNLKQSMLNEQPIDQQAKRLYNESEVQEIANRAAQLAL